MDFARQTKICLFAATVLLSGFVLASCSTESGEPLQPSLTSGGPSSSNYGLYVASGACNAGGVVTSTASGTIAVLDPTTGSLRRIIIDYGSISPGDLPVGIANFDTDNIIVAVENASGRRIDLVRKDGTGYSSYLTNATALATPIRSMTVGTDHSLLVTKAVSVEKFGPSKARITQGANPYINAPAGACAATNTAVTDVKLLSNGKIVYAHGAATPNNKIVMISSTGYAVAGDCLTTLTAPATTALPTSLLTHSSGKLLVGYGSTTAASNIVQAMDVNVLTNVISGTMTAYNDFAIVNGISALAENPADTSVYVANSLSTFNTIERFSFNPTTKLMTRLGPTIGPQYYTKCIASMMVIPE
ncbi:MAG: hypothetical protein V4760_13465 [Bdellovibrionota bacterium]